MFDSIERFQTLMIKSRYNFEALFDDLGLAYLTETEILFVKEHVSVTRPLAEAIDYLQGEKNMYMGHLLPTLRKLDKRLLKELPIN